MFFFQIEMCSYMVNEENVELNKILLLKRFEVFYLSLHQHHEHIPDIVCLDHLQAQVPHQVHALPPG